ncbi:acid phosphatase type 7 [Eurytemora carolleeae]|uniref:acid phosphatase type 7 n=1 Tax=Eurytemora carolleeae TaxID=1294199 RepID=UPI000C76CEC6|nr:acid phosphatase type 7 [Eurytemora carolleeae]|eukprot:XP_023333484.1 acid phosphatase type 7-like [Eurytemora affinis]
MLRNVGTMKILVLLLVNLSLCLGVEYQPRHVHLALGGEPNSLVVTWSTLNRTDRSIALVGRKKIEREYSGVSSLFIDGGEEGREQWIHTVTLNQLKPNKNYFYRVGSELGWSNYFYTKTLPDSTDWSPTIAMFGDMGTENAASLPFLQRGASEGMFQAILHVGDMAYDMAEENGKRGDDFMEQIEPIASTVPYMTCPGNHEHHYNFSNYKARFSMPEDDNKMFYSFNLGPVHFISISTEFYFYLEYGMDQLINQYYWLKQDLEKANTPEARSKRPWIIVFGHRPMYCSNNDDDDCTKNESRTRVGLPWMHWFGLEELMYNNVVDLAVWAHEHSYERLLPVYNRTVLPGPDSKLPYVNPRAPVHIVTGSAGCREKHDGFIPNPPPWSVFRSDEYGFTLLKVVNSTHLRLEQMSVEPDLHSIDQFWIIKSSHSAFS